MRMAEEVSLPSSFLQRLFDFEVRQSTPYASFIMANA